MRPPSALRVAAALVFLAGAARAASAGELTVFVSGGLPTLDWGRGYGGMFTITLFNIVHGEVEGARQASDLADTSLLSLSAKAAVGPTIGRLVPFAGLGVGVYVETRPGNDDRGTLGLLFFGAKLKLPLGVVLRAEYDWPSLPAAAPVKLEGRFLIGAGISF